MAKLTYKKLVKRINEKIAKTRIRNESVKRPAVKTSEILNRTTNFRVAEAYKACRTNVMFTLSNFGDKCKKVVVTSALPGEGKTTTSINLAVSFAQVGSKVLLIDADLRKPSIYRYLNIERRGGLSEVLSGMIDLESSIKKVENHGIDCITSGRIPPNPAELLASDKMGEILEILSERYDYIVIDTPPATVVTDATALTKFVHGVIIVVRQNYTIHETLQMARESFMEFGDAKILGYIMNDVESSSKRYGYYKKYGNTGKYGSTTYGDYSYGNGGYSNYGYGYGYGYGGYGSYGYGDSYGYENYGYGTESEMGNSENDSYVKSIDMQELRDEQKKNLSEDAVKINKDKNKKKNK